MVIISAFFSLLTYFYRERNFELFRNYWVFLTLRLI
jgi:hypothetical protein